MAQSDVADFVGEHASYFTLIFRSLQHSAIDVHRAARQREGIQIAHVDDVEGVSEFRMPELIRNVLHEALADPLDIVVDAVVTQHWKLLRNFARSLAAGLHVFFDLVFVFGRHDLRLSEDERCRGKDRYDRRCSASGSLMI